LGEQGRLRPPADPARRRARAPAKRLIRKMGGSRSVPLQTLLNALTFARRGYHLTVNRPALQAKPPADNPGASPDPFRDNRALRSKRRRLLQPTPTGNNAPTLVKRLWLARRPFFCRTTVKRALQAATADARKPPTEFRPRLV
jgi:hypothetical protein